MGMREYLIEIEELGPNGESETLYELPYERYAQYLDAEGEYGFLDDLLSRAREEYLKKGGEDAVRDLEERLSSAISRIDVRKYATLEAFFSGDLTDKVDIGYIADDSILLSDPGLIEEDFGDKLLDALRTLEVLPVHAL